MHFYCADPTSTPISLWLSEFGSFALLNEGIRRISCGVAPDCDPLLLPAVAIVPAVEDETEDFFEVVEPDIGN